MSRQVNTGRCAECKGPLWRGTAAPSDGRRFGIEGTICARCYIRHYAAWRRAGNRPTRLFERIPDCTLECRAARSPALPVLNGWFGWDDLTARAACRVILMDTRRVFRRATG